MSLFDIKAKGIVKVEAPKQIKQDLSDYEDFMPVKPVLSSEPVKKTEKTTTKSKSKTTTKKTVNKPVEVKSIKKVKLFDEVIIDNLDELLMDKTTEKTILWATDSYEHDPATNVAKEQILELINNGQLQPRVYKSLEERKERTKKKAEVFTPSWICKKMIDMCEEQVDMDWKTYVKSNWLEITCGEGPYLCSRYDTTTGEEIPVNERIGVIDRKLQRVSANCDDSDSWMKAARSAYMHTYGYEYQGDNLFIARVNLVQSFIEHYENKFGKKPRIDAIRNIMNIIVHNIWQMDGLKDTIPFTDIPATIRDWSDRENPTLEFRSMKGA